MREHPLRARLAAEMHARPFVSLQAPMRLWHLALVRDEDPAADRRHLEALCARWDAASPDEDSSHHIAERDALLLKWERHTEFTTWTVRSQEAPSPPFGSGLGERLDPEWLRGLPGRLLVAVRVDVRGPDDALPDTAELRRLFDRRSLCGSLLGDDDTRAWTDFRTDPDGFVRVLVHDACDDAHTLGRRLQRLLELETYRVMALLALPLAQQTEPRVADTGQRLASVTERLRILEDLAAEQALLAELMQLSAEAEELSAATAFRFSASRAYFGIVGDRLTRLAERRIGELPTLGSFLERRLTPAMRTCESVLARQERLAERISRAANLLRTRVDLALEGQNRDLLQSMERRARLQLRLQQTVEGLSVAAITYYVVGLVRYVAGGLASVGLPVATDRVAAIAVPVVAVVIWAGVRRFRYRLERAEHDAGH